MTSPTLPSGYVAVPLQDIELILERYTQGDTSRDPESDRAVVRLYRALDENAEE